MASQKIKVTSLAYVHYQHPDVAKALSFLLDLGLIVEHRDFEQAKIFLRGYGSQPYVYVLEQSPDDKRHFLGGYFAVASRDDLLRAAGLPNASKIQENVAPGGGQVVSTIDPCGNFVGYVYGQKLRGFDIDENSIPLLEKTNAVPVYNTSLRKEREGKWRRFTPGPSPVHKLGHYGFRVPRDKFDKTLEWYTSIMNLKPTDAIYDPKTGKLISCFSHIDLGAEFTDHHVRTPRCFISSLVFMSNIR